MVLGLNPIKIKNTLLFTISNNIYIKVNNKINNYNTISITISISIIIII